MILRRRGKRETKNRTKLNLPLDNEKSALRDYLIATSDQGISRNSIPLPLFFILV